MQRFGTAKVFFEVTVFLGWFTMGLGCLFYFLAYDLATLARISGAIVIALIGLNSIVVSQIGLATIATAENTGELIRILSRGAAAADTQTWTRGRVAGPLVSPGVPKKPGDKIKSYKGYAILKADSGVTVNGAGFVNVLEAEKWINENPLQS